MPQSIVVNSASSGKFRKEVINNRPHIVTEMVSIEGDSVMNSLLYPMNEVKNSFGQLDSIPAPAGHPKTNGKSLSAFHPLAMNAFNVGGFVRNPRMVNGQVINELVFDLEVANKDDRGKKIVERIESGDSIGVSTGLNAQVEKTNGKKGDRPYTGVVNNIKFDHVAVLLDETPAGENTFTINENQEVIVCNAEWPAHDNDTVLTGEGVEVDRVVSYQTAGNGKTNQEENDMDKEKLVLALIGNSTTRFTEAEKDNLMSMSEASLVNAIVSSVEPKIDVENAQKVLEESGMQIVNSDHDADGYAAFVENKAEFEAFQADKAKEKAEKVKAIVANSKMTEEQVGFMSDDGIDALLNSLTPKQNYQAQGQTIRNNDRTAGKAKLHEEA